MGSSKKISVIVPVYNVEKYLRECLDSIVNQTLEDIEIICINDGSTNNSFDILEEYVAKDNKIKIINQEHMGVGAARNNALNFVQGEYLAFIDSDDFIRTDMLEIVYNKFKETEADIVQFDYTICEENGKRNKRFSLSEKLKRESNYELKNNSTFKLSDINNALTGLRMYCWDKMYRTDFIKENNIKFAESSFCEDQIFSISSYLLAKKIFYLNDYLYTYRIREGSLSHRPSDDIESVFHNIELLKDFLVKNGIYEGYRKTYRKYIIKALHRQYVVITKEKEKEFLQKCSDLLTPPEYKRLIKETESKYSLGQKIFSVKNQIINGTKHKTLCVLGFKKSFIAR